MNLLRYTALCAALTIGATACGNDDPASTEFSATTVPVVSAGATTTVPDVDPDATTTTGETDPDPSEDTTTTSPPSSLPTPVNGDLTLAAVGATSLGTYAEPVDTTVAANGELWLAERGGRVVVLDPDTGEIGDTLVDISSETTTDSERGLLGLTTDGEHLYVNFTDLDGHTMVDAFTLDGAGRPDQRHHLLTIEQPFDNHNGGGMAIGPDGHLYIGVGDGGSGGDPLGAGQDPTQLLGSLLRIDPTPGASSPYEIPADNPYADGAEGQPEIFAIGLRNPWRFSFDPATNDLWIADVGQNEWEEVDLLLGANGFGLGANLGWNLREGTREFSGDRPPDNVDPVFEYAHSGGTPTGCSISGGVVYRGTAIPELVGAYVFADFCENSVWALSIVDDTVVFRDLDVAVRRLVGITADADGELLTLSLSGDISRLVPG